MNVKAILISLLLTLAWGCKKDDAMTTIYRDGEPPVSRVDEDDPEMKQAVKKARDTMDQFIAALEKPGEKMFSLKVGLPTPDNSMEFIWVDVESYNNGIFKGTLGNTPINLPKWKLDDPIDVKKEDVQDWIIMDGEEMIGGYSSKLLKERAAKSQ